MTAGIFQAAVSALSKTALISDDIPVAAANLIEVEVKSSHPDLDPELLPSPKKNGKHMTEGEFYAKAAGASLVPKTAIALALGGATAGLSFIGLSSILTVGLVPLALWICGKSAEKEETDENIQKEEDKEYKPSWTDRLIEKTPARNFLDRLPVRHRRILGETINMDVALEMEMMTLAAVSLGASGLATAGIAGVAATVAIMPMVAVAATAVVWSVALGVRKLRNFIGKNQKAIDAGERKETRLDRVLKFIDRNIEPTLGVIGKAALMAIGGSLLLDQGIIPLANAVMPHISASLVPGMQGAIEMFKGLPDIAQLAACAPLGYGVGRFIYNPVIAPALGAMGRAAGKVFGRHRKQAGKQHVPAPVPSVRLSVPANQAVRAQGRLQPSFSSRGGAMPSVQNAEVLRTLTSSRAGSRTGTRRVIGD